MSRQLLIPVEEAGQRVDKLLSAALEDMTRSAVQNLIENGCVTCGGKALSKSAKLKPGDQILVELPEVATPSPASTAWPGRESSTALTRTPAAC